MRSCRVLLQLNFGFCKWRYVLFGVVWYVNSSLLSMPSRVVSPHAA